MIALLTEILARLDRIEAKLDKPSIEPPPSPPVPTDSIWETLKLDDAHAEIVQTDYGWVSKQTQMAQYDHDETVWRAWRGEAPDSRIINHGQSLDRARKHVIEWYSKRADEKWDEVAAVEKLLAIRELVPSPLMSPKPQPHKSLESWWNQYMAQTRGGAPGVSVGGTD